VPHDELAPISVRDADGDTRVTRQRVDSRIARLGSEQGAVHSGLKGIPKRRSGQRQPELMTVANTRP
jgi:hypothetical protein